MGFQAQQNVAVGQFRDSTAPLRSAITNIQSRMRNEQLDAAKLKQQGIDNQYRADQARATADYRAGMTSRAAAAESRAADMYNIAKSDKAANELASGLYSDVKTTTGMAPGSKELTALQNQAELVLPKADNFKKMQGSMERGGETVAKLDKNIVQAQEQVLMDDAKLKNAGGIRLSKKEYDSFEANKKKLDNLSKNRAFAQTDLDIKADTYMSEYNKAVTISDTGIEVDNALTAKTSTQYAKDLKNDLVTQAVAAKGGKALTKAENSALDKRVKGYLDSRAAAKKEVTDAKKAQEKFEDKEEFKTDQKIRAEAAKPKKETAATIKQREVTAAQKTIRDAESGYGDKDTKAYKAARDTLRRFNVPYESNYWLF